MAEKDLAQLITDVKESLEREIGSLAHGVGSLRQEMREGFAQINTRFDTQATRLDRHAALWASRAPLERPHG